MSEEGEGIVQSKVFVVRSAIQRKGCHVLSPVCCCNQLAARQRQAQALLLAEVRGHQVVGNKGLEAGVEGDNVFLGAWKLDGPCYSYGGAAQAPCGCL